MQLVLLSSLVKSFENTHNTCTGGRLFKEPPTNMRSKPHRTGKGVLKDDPIAHHFMNW